MPTPPPMMGEPAPHTAEYSLVDAKLPIKAILGICAGLLTAGGAIAVGRNQVDELQRAKVVHTETLADHETRLRLREDHDARNEATLERLEKKMDRLLEGGLRAPGAHR